MKKPRIGMVPALAIAALLALGGCGWTPTSVEPGPECGDGRPTVENVCPRVVDSTGSDDTDRDPGYKYKYTKKCGKPGRWGNLSKWSTGRKPPPGSTILVCTRKPNIKKEIARYSKRLQNTTGIKKCTDVTSYDHNWYNDMLCTRRDGSRFYTDYAGADAFLGYKKEIARYSKRLQNTTGIKKCTDVTSYDHNWYNDMLCTRRDGSRFYTDYAGADAFLGY